MYRLLFFNRALKRNPFIRDRRADLKGLRDFIEVEKINMHGFQQASSSAKGKNGKTLQAAANEVRAQVRVVGIMTPAEEAARKNPLHRCKI